MDYRIVENKGGFIFFEVSGKYSLDEGKKKIEEIYATCQERQIKKLLVDSTKKDGIISTTDRFIFGEVISKLCSAKIKFAVIGKKDQIDRFSETVAYNRGASLRIFSDKNEAVCWLLK